MLHFHQQPFKMDADALVRSVFLLLFLYLTVIASEPASDVGEEREQYSKRDHTGLPAGRCRWSGTHQEVYTTEQKIPPDFMTPMAGGFLVCQPYEDNGWLPILRRVDDDRLQNFSRSWEEYRYSFGETHISFWLGNEYVHHLTRSRAYRLRVELTDWSGEMKYAEYTRFGVGSYEEEYPLTALEYTGTAGDALPQNNGMKFSAIDRDNDECLRDCDCSKDYHGGGGWWFFNCGQSSLTGRHLPEGEVGRNGINWKEAWGDNRSLKKVEMMIKPL